MQIISMGGGGFSESDNLALDRYVLDQARSEHPRVCFLAQASGEAPNYVVRFHATFVELGAIPIHLSLFHLPTADLASYLAETDVIYVGGGNTRSLLALWRTWELDLILPEIAREGTVLAGVSAGAACWFEQILTDSIPGKLTAMDGLGLLDGSFCPHYHSEPRRRPTYRKWVAEGRIEPGIAADDGVALHFIDGSLHRTVRCAESAGAYRVRGNVEEPMECEPLDRLRRMYR